GPRDGFDSPPKPRDKKSRDRVISCRDRRVRGTPVWWAIRRVFRHPKFLADAGIDRQEALRFVARTHGEQFYYPITLSFLQRFCGAKKSTSNIQHCLDAGICRSLALLVPAPRSVEEGKLWAAQDVGRNRA